MSATEIMRRMRKHFNNFQDRFDRKLLIETFSLLRRELGFSVEKLIGSQVILTRIDGCSEGHDYDETILYDSESEGELADPAKFERFVLKELRRII
jgi:hypothetical protein